MASMIDGFQRLGRALMLPIAVLPVAGDSAGVDIAAGLALLAERGIIRLLVEGGAPPAQLVRPGCRGPARADPQPRS